MRDALCAAHPDRLFRIVTQETIGDLVLDRPIKDIGAVGVFTKVHSRGGCFQSVAIEMTTVIIVIILAILARSWNRCWRRVRLTLWSTR